MKPIEANFGGGERKSPIRQTAVLPLTGMTAKAGEVSLSE